MSARDRQRFAVAFSAICAFAVAILLFGMVVTPAPANAQTPTPDPSCDPTTEVAASDWDYGHEPCMPSWARDTAQVQAVYDAAAESVMASMRVVLGLGFVVVAIPLYALLFSNLGTGRE